MLKLDWRDTGLQNANQLWIEQLVQEPENEANIEEAACILKGLKPFWWEIEGPLNSIMIMPFPCIISLIN